MPHTTSQYRAVAGASGTAANFLLLGQLLGLTPPQLAEVSLSLTLTLTLTLALTLALAPTRTRTRTRTLTQARRTRS